MCGGTSKIPRLQKHIASMFPNAEQLNSISPDEVLALGAASQSSLLNEAWLDTDNSSTIAILSHGTFLSQITGYLMENCEHYIWEY